ncbi:MAG: formate dehydrogenase accessory sulfurtransferase FdhD [Candidatus Lokiarchaeota archaeon]
MFKRKIHVTRIKKNKKIQLEDEVLIEQSIDIIVNNSPLVNIICLPKDLKELAAGFLFTIGIIERAKDIKNINVNSLDNKINIELNNSIEVNIDSIKMNPVSRVVDTTCGISSPWRDMIKKSLEKDKELLKSKEEIKIDADFIYSAIKKMQIETILYRKTGGCHGAAIFNLLNEVESVKEDIGRHNAIDKVIGDLLLRNVPFNNKILTTTGRLTGDSVLKAIKAHIPIMASLSAGIESGIRLAFGYGLTLIGFVRGSRMNIYSHPERIYISK